MKNIWTFGCSFSSGYLDVPQEKTYNSLIANELGKTSKNISNPGNCNDKIFFDFTNNIDNIKRGDKIIYQFTSFNRVGFFDDFNDIKTYFSSAGIPELGVKHKKKEKEFSKYTLKELDALLSYILIWQDKRNRFILDNSINLLEHLKKTKKIDYIIIFLKNDCEFLNDNVLNLPIDDNQTNISLNDYLDFNKLTLGHEFSEKYKFGDTHPGFSGHEKIKELILNKKQWA
jgi:hypothetical protein